jgi:hypothetical protein
MRIWNSVRWFFFAEPGAESEDHLMHIVRQDPEAAAWFIEMTMMFSTTGCFAAFGVSTAFLCLHWQRCSACDRPFRWWILFQAVLQLVQVPVRLVITTAVKDIRRVGGDLEAVVQAVTASLAWRSSKMVSLVFYGWFILGIVWWVHSSDCEECPGIHRLTMAVMALSLARAAVAMGMYMYLFPHLPEAEFQAPEAPSIKGATAHQIDSLEVVRVPWQDTQGAEEEAEDFSESCAVCLAEFDNGDVMRRLPCKHLFHMNCIDKWLQKNKRCPLCMHAIDEAKPAIEELAALRRRTRACTHAGEVPC